MDFSYSEFVLKDEAKGVFRLSELMKKQAQKQKKGILCVDITALSIFDACRIALQLSVECFSMSPERLIRWVVRSKEAKTFIDQVKLSNMEVLTVSERENALQLAV